MSGNSATGTGGGIYSFASGLTLTNSTVSGNGTDGNGGGIFNNGLLMLTNSTVSGNSASSGGGIRFIIVRRRRQANLFNATITNNEAAVIGGGVSMYRAPPSTSKTRYSLEILHLDCPPTARVLSIQMAIT